MNKTAKMYFFFKLTAMVIAKKIAVFAISIAEFCDRNRSAIGNPDRITKKIGDYLYPEICLL